MGDLSKDLEALGVKLGFDPRGVAPAKAASAPRTVGPMQLAYDAPEDIRTIGDMLGPVLPEAASVVRSVQAYAEEGTLPFETQRRVQALILILAHVAPALLSQIGEEYGEFGFALTAAYALGDAHGRKGAPRG